MSVETLREALDPPHPEDGEMRSDIFAADDESAARRRLAYRRERDLLANATSAHLVGLLSSDDDLRRTAARDELLRRGEHVGT